MPKTQTAGLRRFTEHERRIGASQMSAADPAAMEGHTRYKAMVFQPDEHTRVFKSGHHNKKIGKKVLRGRWSGMPIYTLTLEERATCPRSCHHWLDCYGNKMHWSQRLAHGQELEEFMELELMRLQQTHPGGFVIRLHILGDFYSIGYVVRWLGWLKQFPALRVYGYTAHRPGTPIGDSVNALRKRIPERFAIRVSLPAGEAVRGWPAAVTVRPGEQRPPGVSCPAQQDQTECCSTCALCWDMMDKAVLFVEH